MDWKWQLVISIGLPLISSILTYLAAIKKANKEIEAVRINADTKIKSIETEYQKQIEKMKVETEEQIKLKIAESELASKGDNEKMKNEMAKEFLGQFMNDPKKGGETFSALIDFAKKNGMK